MLQFSRLVRLIAGRPLSLADHLAVVPLSLRCHRSEFIMGIVSHNTYDGVVDADIDSKLESASPYFGIEILYRMIRR